MAPCGVFARPRTGEIRFGTRPCNAPSIASQTASRSRGSRPLSGAIAAQQLFRELHGAHYGAAKKVAKQLLDTIVT